MKCDLIFLKDFRSKRGFDCEILDLYKDGVPDDFTTKEGVYIICSKGEQMIYPNGKSRILYIGKADNLKRRLKEHYKHLITAYEDYSTGEIWCTNRYNYMCSFGAHIYVYHCLGKKLAKELESEIMERFYDKYKAIPIGNGARSFR